MGQSTDAILAWGISFGEGEEFPWAEAAEEAGYDDPTSDEAMAFLLCGLEKPRIPYEEDEKAHSAYWDAQRNALEEYEVELVRHCHHEYPMYMLVISDSKRRAWRGSPVEIDENHLDVFDDWLPGMREACAKLGIEKPDAKWWLFSDWS